MAEVNFRFDFKLGPEKLRWLLAAIFVLAAAPELGSETVTLSTYYPAPSGVYTNMITTNNTYLARDGGNVNINQSAANAGANTKLAVNGGLAVGAYAAATNAPANGMVVSGSVGIGNVAPAYPLDVTGTFRASVDGLIGGNMSVTGNETIGGNSTITGSATIGNGENLTGGLSGTYGLIPGYRDWAAYGTGSGGAAIYNDANTFRTLMIVGNNSAGTGLREVGVWDNMTINGKMRVNRAITAAASSGSSCSSVSGAPNSVLCGAGNYVTTTAGVYARYGVASILPTGSYQVNGGATFQISALCCPLSETTGTIW